MLNFGKYNCSQVGSRVEHQGPNWVSCFLVQSSVETSIVCDFGLAEPIVIYSQGVTSITFLVFVLVRMEIHYCFND